LIYRSRVIRIVFVFDDGKCGCGAGAVIPDLGMYHGRRVCTLCDLPVEVCVEKNICRGGCFA